MLYYLPKNLPAPGQFGGRELWSREGYVPDHPDKMYSGLGKAYGVATVLSLSTSTCAFIH